jgi:hypothetical protein
MDYLANDLGEDFDATMEGLGMPIGNKKAGFVGLMLAKKHLRRGPNSYDTPQRAKATPARFNTNAMALLNRHGRPNPSQYVQNIYPRAQQQPAQPARPRGRPRVAPQNLAPTGRLTKAQRDALKAQADAGNAQARATLDAFRQNEAQRARKARMKKARTAIGQMAQGAERDQAIRNFQITYGEPYQAQGQGRGGVRPRPKQFLDIAKTSYQKTPPQNVSDFQLVFNTPTLDAWVNEPRSTIVLSVRGTDTSDKGDLAADASIPFNRLSKSNRYIQDKQYVQQIIQRYDPQRYEYYLTGHSLGGAIVNQLKRDFPFFKDAVEYNAAFQPYDFIRQQNDQIQRNYTANDPLYRLGGRFFSKVNVLPAKPSVATSLGAVGNLYDALQGHSLSNFDQLVGGAVSMGDKAYMKEHKKLINTLAHPTKRKLKNELMEQRAEVQKKICSMNGKPYTGRFHIMDDGSIHTGATHTKSSKPLQVC